MSQWKKKVLVSVMAFSLVSTMLPVQSLQAAGKVKAVKVTNVTGKKLSLAKGKSKKLKVKVIAKGKVSQKVKFQSNNSGIAKVSNKGKVTALKKGTAKVTITSKADKKKKFVLKVKVTDKNTDDSVTGTTKPSQTPQATQPASTAPQVTPPAATTPPAGTTPQETQPAGPEAPYWSVGIYRLEDESWRRKILY